MEQYPLRPAPGDLSGLPRRPVAFFPMKKSALVLGTGPAALAGADEKDVDRYERQILDCDNNPTYADGMAGAFHGQTPPLVNAVCAAGEWQTYDIRFTAPKLAAGKFVEPAYVTILVNGIVVQNHTKILGPTLHKKATKWGRHVPPAGAVPLPRSQEHDPRPFPEYLGAAALSGARKRVRQRGA